MKIALDITDFHKKYRDTRSFAFKYFRENPKDIVDVIWGDSSVYRKVNPFVLSNYFRIHQVLNSVWLIVRQEDETS